MGRHQKIHPNQPQVGFALPYYVLIQMRALAVRERCSMRALVLKALPSIGIHVDPVDLVDDGRTLRPKGKRTHYAMRVKKPLWLFPGSLERALVFLGFVNPGAGRLGEEHLAAA